MQIALVNNELEMEFCEVWKIAVRAWGQEGEHVRQAGRAEIPAPPGPQEEGSDLTSRRLCLLRP